MDDGAAWSGPAEHLFVRATDADSVLTGHAGTRHRVILVEVEPETGAMAVDSAFTDPHGAVFARPAGGEP